MFFNVCIITKQQPKLNLFYLLLIFLFIHKCLNVFLAISPFNYKKAKKLRYEEKDVLPYKKNNAKHEC